MTDSRHPRQADLYTPFGPDVLAILMRMHDEYGSWRRVAAITETRMRVIRVVKSGRRKAISQRFMDRLITKSGVGNLEQLPWFTADDLVTLGVWKHPQYVEGPKRIKGNEVTIAEKHGRTSEATRAKQKAQRRRKRYARVYVDLRKNELGYRMPKWLRRP